MKKTGVFVCHCGKNISSTVNIDKVVQEISINPNVTVCRDYKYMCSEPGQNLIVESIESNKLERVVVACCTPSLHEETFRKAAESSGLNRYYLEIANIREQCSWVHSDMNKATPKAISIISSLIEKIKMNDSLEPIKVPVTQKALIIGAGIAGIQAALDVANSGYKVTLVEKDP
ncbi:MAG: CoB--CoM heterodisulfide reductase iron-sulfur subunit A family protein, partial [Candidatus Cloacimonetes bacterium]|nr:CoB--CoM heterodisulfide reductase iron-sulfur subunit A family protein [Candidatus Cloacimonadota bacterium]